MNLQVCILIIARIHLLGEQSALIGIIFYPAVNVAKKIAKILTSESKYVHIVIPGFKLRKLYIVYFRKDFSISIIFETISGT